MATSTAAPSSLQPKTRTHGALLAALAVAVAATVASCGDGGSTSGATPKITGAAARRGAAVAGDNGCQTCHTTNGKRTTGPTWKDLAGSEVELDGGGKVAADDAYLSRAIVDPKAEVVSGFPSIMPSYDLSGDEVQDLVAYLKALSSEPSPPG